MANMFFLLFVIPEWEIRIILETNELRENFVTDLGCGIMKYKRSGITISTLLTPLDFV